MTNMFDIMLILIYIYLVLVYLGIGIFALITPDVFKKPYLYVLIAPGFGFCLLAIVGSWVIATNIAITWTIILSLLIATGLNLFVLWRANIRERISFKRFKPAKKTLPKVLLNSILLLVILFLLILPGIRGGHLTTPLRLGPDAIGYAGAAQALTNGETLSSIAEDLKTVTGKQDLEEAKVNNSRLLRFDLHCSSEFLLKALRWGYPIILANMTWATGQDSVYRLDFVLLIFSYAMLLGLVYYSYRNIIKARRYICLLLTAALALNANLLNIYYEGSYAQVMATPILFMLLLYLYNLRKNNTSENRSIQMKQVAFVGFLCAGLLSIWNEAFIILGIVCFIILALDLLVMRRMQKIWMIAFCAGALLAFFLITPLTLNLILFVKSQLFNHLHNISAGGWWQPQWATLPEIMGWINIYAHSSQPPNILSRDSVEIVSVFLGSLLIVAVGEYYIFSNRKLDRAFWLAPVLFVLLVYAKCIFLDQTINYQYYKAYTVLLPVIFLFIYAALFYLMTMVTARLKYVLYGIIALSIFMTVFSGVSYIKKYYEESNYFTEEMSYLQKQSELLSNYVLMTPFGPHYSQVEQIASTVKMNWYDYYFEQAHKVNRIKEPYLDMLVAIILFADDQKNVSINSDDVIFTSKEFEIVKTLYKLKDRLNEDGTVDINRYFDYGAMLTFGPTVFSDEDIGNSITAVGDAHITTGEKRFGTGSAAFDSTGDYLTVTNSSVFNFGSGDFTIEGWFNFNVNDTGYQFIVDRRGDIDGTGWIFYLEGNNQLSFLSSSGAGWDNKVLFETGVVPETGKWMHLAVVRNGNVFTMYQDGVAIKSGTFTGSIGAQKTIDLTIGAGHVVPYTNGFNGYIDELRISKGIARWTSNFTLPLAPYKLSTEADVDSYTKLLIHFDSHTKLSIHADGIDGSTAFTDEIGNGIIAVGDAHITTGEKRFGTASAVFDGAGDYLTVKNSADFNFGSGDFTIEGWFYFNANKPEGRQAKIDIQSAMGYARGYLRSSGAGWDNKVLFETGVVPETGEWIHLAVVRYGNVFTMFKDGIAIKSGTFTDSIGAQKTIDLTIGAGHVVPYTNGFNGYIDELRISKGIARWTANFTPPNVHYAREGDE